MHTITKGFAPLMLMLLLAVAATPPAHAQLQEPEVLDIEEPRTLWGEGLRNGLGANLVVNNFGLGLQGHYSRILSPYTELTLSVGITGIRDVSEQSFQDFFTGQRVIPNKYNRALGFPFLVGIKHRMFARQIDDNFRLFISTAAGPALGFTYPYFNDVDNSGFRNVVEVNGVPRVEKINDFFSGWSDGASQWGLSAEFKVGVDFGENFRHLTRVEFGYFFYYFQQGLQILEPYQGITNSEGTLVDREPFHDAQKFFGTPQISLIFGSMW
ncbi:MAG: hypothetical protein U5K31_06290 [Balneolaceae bacterium]|nr:hypothetical protein [Balneolaceae bacterium]